MKKFAIFAFMAIFTTNTLCAVVLFIPNKRLAQLQTDCDNGESLTCAFLGILYTDDRSYKKAVASSKKACDLKIMAGCHNLGLFYAKGKSVRKNYARAIRLYQQACNGGYAASCNNLGKMYYKGKGAKQSYQNAAENYKKACEKKNIIGCLNAGKMYSKAIGVTQDLQAAKEFYGKACDLGNKKGCKKYLKINKMNLATNNITTNNNKNHQSNTAKK